MNRPARPRGAATELKIPAEPRYVIVAKRAASALGATAGFSMEGVDDLNIAVAQACEKAIAAADRMWGPGNAVLKLTFHIVAEGIEVEVRSVAGPEAGTEPVRGRLEAERRAESYRQAAARLSEEVESERESRILAQREAARLAEINRRMAGAAIASTEPSAEVDVDFEDLAVNMIRLFVDELRYNVDSRGAMRMRMVKYHVD